MLRYEANTFIQVSEKQATCGILMTVPKLKVGLIASMESILKIWIRCICGIGGSDQYKG